MLGWSKLCRVPLALPACVLGKRKLEQFRRGSSGSRQGFPPPALMSLPLWRSRLGPAAAAAAVHAAASPAQASSEQVADLWENQRYYYAFGWCAQLQHLKLATTRRVGASHVHTLTKRSAILSNGTQAMKYSLQRAHIRC